MPLHNDDVVGSILVYLFFRFSLILLQALSGITFITFLVLKVAGAVTWGFGYVCIPLAAIFLFKGIEYLWNITEDAKIKTGG